MKAEPVTFVQKDRSMELQKQMIAENYDAFSSAHENSRKIYSTFVPGNHHELGMCFGLHNNLP